MALRASKTHFADVVIQVVPCPKLLIAETNEPISNIAVKIFEIKLAAKLVRTEVKISLADLVLRPFFPTIFSSDMLLCDGYMTAM